MLGKRSELNIFNWYMELGALIFLAIAVVIVYSAPSTNFKLANIFISGLICGYILFKKKLKFRAIFITIGWIIGLIIGSKLNMYLVIVVFTIGSIITYYSFKNKWLEI